MNEKLLAEVQETYSRLTSRLILRNITVSTMESCTSGLVASLLTDTEGASSVFPGAAVTYCNEQKRKNGVPGEVLEKYTVYSAETAESMAEAAARSFGTDLGIGITGCFADADPANACGIPGSVYYAVCFRGTLKNGKLILPEGITRTESKLETAKAVAGLVFSIIGEADF